MSENKQSEQEKEWKNQAPHWAGSSQAGPALMIARIMTCPEGRALTDWATQFPYLILSSILLDQMCMDPFIPWDGHEDVTSNKLQP